MTQATQRTQIYNIVNGVSNIGNVYPRERWANRWAEILTLLKATVSGTDQIRAWMITCQGAPQNEYLTEEYVDPQGNNVVIRTFRWVIRGFVTFNDGDNTEEEALNLALAVVDSLSVASTLHDGSTYWDEQPPADLGIFELRIFGGVLCHYIEITQLLTEAVSISS